MRECLILVDLQNDYFPGGSMELVGADNAAANAQLLLTQFRTAGLPIVHVQHLSLRPGATFFLPGTDGAEINDLVSPEAGETVVTKHYPNSFRDTDLLGRLRADTITNLVIDPKIDENTFKLKVPEGYEKTDDFAT